MENLNYVSLEQVRQYRGGGLSGKTSEASGDVFMQIIDNMLESMKQSAGTFGESGGVSAAGLFEELNNSRLEAASVEAAGLLGYMPGMNLDLVAMLTQSAGAEQVDALDGLTSGFNVYEQLAGDVRTNAAGRTQAAADGETDAQQLTAEFISYLEGAGETAEQQAAVPTVAEAVDESEGFAETLSRQQSDEGEQRKAADAGELAAEQLAETKVYRSIGELMLERPAQTMQPSLTEQVTQQMQNHLKAGESEFTMSLRPRELGEITVRIVEKAGKTTLSIVTATKEAADALNRELATLKAAVSPMDVEVKPAQTRNDAAAEQQQMRFDDERGGQRNRRQQQPRERRDEKVESFSSSIEQVFADLARGVPQPVSA